MVGCDTQMWISRRLRGTSPMPSRIVQSMGSKLVREKTGLNLTFQKVRLNPFTFTAVLENLSLGQAGKEPFLTMAQLYADFEALSILAGPYRFKRIRIDASHIREFLQCVKSRATTAANADVAAQSHVAAHAAYIAWQLGRSLNFDPQAEQFPGDEQANRMRSRAYRPPWQA